MHKRREALSNPCPDQLPPPSSPKTDRSCDNHRVRANYHSRRLQRQLSSRCLSAHTLSRLASSGVLPCQSLRLQLTESLLQIVRALLRLLTPCGKSRRTDRSSNANYLRLGGGTAVSICILAGAEVGLGSTLFRQRLQISDNVLPVFFVWH